MSLPKKNPAVVGRSSLATATVKFDRSDDVISTSWQLNISLPPFATYSVDIKPSRALCLRQSCMYIRSSANFVYAYWSSPMVLLVLFDCFDD